MSRAMVEEEMQSRVGGEVRPSTSDPSEISFLHAKFCLVNRSHILQVKELVRIRDGLHNRDHVSVVCVQVQHEIQL